MLRALVSSLLFLILLGFIGNPIAKSILPDFFTGGLPEPPPKREKVDFDGLLVDKILVKKSKRRLYLIKDDKPILSYPIALGFEPNGHKARQGDGRTPEGVYRLDWRNPKSKFYKSIHVSYPNVTDRRQARRLGQDPGGMIMIHGQPRSRKHADLQLIASKEDWTHGCIAVPNYAIDQIWEYTPDGTPIEILP